jgi:zinc protease
VTTTGRLLLAMLLLAATSCASDEPEPNGAPATTRTPSSVETSNADPVRTTLANGLDVAIAAVPDATGVAAALVFDVGSHHDPAAQSGMAHMIEHLFVTGATESEPARTVEELVSSYPLGWNAQTGEDYTVIASVVDADDLDDELDRMASRLRSVAPTGADLAREEPRLQAELVNMFGGIPEIGAANLARERLRPTPDDGRRGGHPDAVAAFTLDDLVDRLALYHPGNAHLSVAGPIDPAATLEMITDHFAAIPNGPPIGDPAVAGIASPGLHIVPVPPSVTVQGPGHVTLAYPAPAANDPAYPAFLVAAGRLFIRGQQQRFVTSFAPLDDPPHLLVAAPLAAGDDPNEAAGAIHDGVVTVLDSDLGPTEGSDTARQFGPFLGLPGATGADSYGTAFRAARTPALGLDPEALASSLESLTQEDFEQVVEALADQPVTGGAIVVETT